MVDRRLTAFDLVFHREFDPLCALEGADGEQVDLLFIKVSDCFYYEVCEDMQDPVFVKGFLEVPIACEARLLVLLSFYRVLVGTARGSRGQLPYIHRTRVIP